MTSDILNEHQRRHYQVLLSMLAQSAARLETLATARASDDSVFLEYEEDLPRDFAAHIEPHLTALRRTLAQLASMLDIRPKRLSRRNAARAILVTEIVRLEDSMAKGLRGYGEVDPRVRENLDPLLDQLTQNLRAMRLELEGRPAASERERPS